MTAKRVTGKQVLDDCVTLAKDLCVFIVDLGRRAYDCIKTAIDKNKTTEQPEKQ